MSSRHYGIRQCSDCGASVRKQIRREGPCYCLPCGHARAVRAAQQMAAKSGPAWDRWLESNGAARMKDRQTRK